MSQNNISIWSSDYSRQSSEAAFLTTVDCSNILFGAIFFISTKYAVVPFMLNYFIFNTIQLDDWQIAFISRINGGISAKLSTIIVFLFGGSISEVNDVKFKTIHKNKIETFDELFNGVIEHECYYANIQGDHGGETYMGVARNLHPDRKGWEYIDAYKQTDGNIKWNFKIDNPKLTQLVKDFYEAEFYNKYRIADISHDSLQEIILDWCVNSGRWGVRGVQRRLNQSFDTNLNPT